MGKQSGPTDPGIRRMILTWLAVTIGLILLVPLGAMYFIEDMNWSVGDFVVMAALLFAVSALFVLITRVVRSQPFRIVLAVLLALLFVYIWAELAVGIFTNWGS